jgi:succinoglycan biosynthesis transport protein ExoP
MNTNDAALRAPDRHNAVVARERALLARGLRRRWPLVVLCAALAAGVALAISLAQEKQYTATASLLFRDPGFDKALFGAFSLPDSEDPGRQAATNTNLVSLPVVADRVARELGGDLTGRDVELDTKVSAVGTSNLNEIAVTDPDPQLAARMANAVGEQYIAFRRDADRAKVEEAQRRVRSELESLRTSAHSDASAVQALEQRLQELVVLASLQTGNAELVQPALVPTSPSSPLTKRNIALGALVGLLIGVGLVLVLERMDQRIRDTDELEELWGKTPILATVPQSPVLASGSLGGVGERESEAFAMLGARLRYFNVDDDVKLIISTSAVPGEGKTTVAWNLAASAAARGRTRVLLVEADMRKSTMATRYNLRRTPGLAELLARLVSLDEVITEAQLQGPDGRSSATLDVIVAGAAPPNPAELLESKAMAAVLEVLRERYDFIVIDTPPAGIISDALPLFRACDGIVVVNRLGMSRRDMTSKFVNDLSSMGAPVLGVVANGVEERDGAYAYYYGAYSNDAAKTRPDDAVAAQSAADR